MIDLNLSTKYFWEISKIYNDEQIVIIDSTLDNKYTAKQIQKIIDYNKDKLNNIYPDNSKKLACILSNNQLQDIIYYLTALQRNDAVMLLDIKTNTQLLQELLTKYYPDWVIGEDLSEEQTRLLIKLGYQKDNDIWIYIDTVKNIAEKSNKTYKQNIDIFIDLSVLLSTSGTTGSPKMVRLSPKNLQANARSIATYLQLDTNERAITSLPLSYSYGLSVINSHLLAGATLLLTNDSVMSKTYWDFFKQAGATSMAGVPYTYQMLHRMRFSSMDLPSLRTLTQAGGRLSEDLIKHFWQLSQDRGWRFFVMYGQTEATARMSYVPIEMLEHKIGSIGIAIPGGRFDINEETSELIYNGDNVMLGYAESRADLAKGDELKGNLATGDIAIRDEEGYYYITGRLKRFVKLFGLRINLDDVEKQIQQQFKTIVACTGNDDMMTIWFDTKIDIKAVNNYLNEQYSLHHSAYRVETIDQIPKTLNGKIDYMRLK